MFRKKIKYEQCRFDAWLSTYGEHLEYFVNHNMHLLGEPTWYTQLDMTYAYYRKLGHTLQEWQFDYLYKLVGYFITRAQESAIEENWYEVEL